MDLQPMMLVGTGSDTGKSVLATAFCRIFLQDGYQPAPFKAQNMSLNSFATPDGLELGRAQAVQAEACRLACHTDMNPILLKPQSDHTSQVIVNGRPDGNQSAGSYFKKEGRERFRTIAHEAFDRLAQRYSPIVMEGAGSVSEINLREVDIVNMSMAIYAGASVFLVADIDRGGVFASVYGSFMLLTEEERRHMKGIIINKFRGDIRLFDEGVRMLEQLCGVPVIGVVPYFHDIYIEEEDSVSLAMKSRNAAQDSRVNVAVVLLHHLSNFTDFDVLERDARVHLYYATRPEDLDEAQIVILPGTKSTIDDLYHLRREGMASAILKARERGATILGICGGYQMMGREVSDPQGLEGDVTVMPGLGLLPVVTEMAPEKTTRQMQFHSRFAPGTLTGYEIHMGSTVAIETPSPLNRLESGADDGYWVDDRCMGTYLHGILDNEAFVDALVGPYTSQQHAEPFDYAAFKQQQYDLLADHVRRHVDMDLVYRILG